VEVVPGVSGKSVPLENTRQSTFRFVLMDHNANNLAASLLQAEQKADKLFATINSSIAEGLLLFEETDDYVFILATVLPSAGEIRVLVSERLREPFKRAASSVGLKPDFTKSEYPG